MAGIEQAKTIDQLPERFNAATDLIDHNISAGRGDKTAIIDCNGATTYRQLADRVDRMANALRSAGIAREQRVLLCLLDTVDFPTAFLGAIKAGIVPVPLNTLMVADDYRWILENSRASAVVVSAELVGQWSRIAQDFPHVRFISTGEGHWNRLGDLLAAAEPVAEAADTHRDEVAFWLYTSGSTGRPKGAMHLHSSMRLTANLFGSGIVGLGPDDVVLSVAKQFFAYGLGNNLSFPYAAGATVVLLKERATPEAISTLIKEHKVSFFFGVPTFYAGWLASEVLPEQNEVPSLRLAISAGEALPSHIGAEIQDRFGIDVLDGLGSTEMLHIFLSQRPGSVRFGSTGRPVPGYELRIATEDGAACAVDEIGELEVKGPSSAIGYWANRSKSTKTFVGEWTRTGDKYSCDQDGWYTYHGRSDDMLKVGGIYVSPTEVEQALSSHEAVLEAAVVGAPDSDTLIKPRAHIVLRQGVTPGPDIEAALKAHVKSQLAPYKYPRWIVFADELPKTATGKIQRFRLRGGE